MNTASSTDQKVHLHGALLLRAEVLCAAIAGRQVVNFLYKERRRRVEPHILGADHEGRPILSGWQRSGGSGQAFRSYHLEAISELCATAERFSGPRRDYNPEHAIFAQIACRI